ncbi:hypothetical protein MKZ38_000303 [Zalerion maritima]|uniref:Uncharacterized protein n=1 Tax=Zalerion maritima TaxID=339359 RepID=A0AAD5RRQ8_9PEZI|nr:hypothetical protein MKZ38_000303 [Zalerion maritima]
MSVSGMLSSPTSSLAGQGRVSTVATLGNEYQAGLIGKVPWRGSHDELTQKDATGTVYARNINHTHGVSTPDSSNSGNSYVLTIQRSLGGDDVELGDLDKDGDRDEHGSPSSGFYSIFPMSPIGEPVLGDPDISSQEATITRTEAEAETSSVASVSDGESEREYISSILQASAPPICAGPPTRMPGSPGDRRPATPPAEEEQQQQQQQQQQQRLTRMGNHPGTTGYGMGTRARYSSKYSAEEDHTEGLLPARSLELVSHNPSWASWYSNAIKPLLLKVLVLPTNFRDDRFVPERKRGKKEAGCRHHPSCSQPVTGMCVDEPEETFISIVFAMHHVGSTAIPQIEHSLPILDVSLHLDPEVAPLEELWVPRMLGIPGMVHAAWGSKTHTFALSMPAAGIDANINVHSSARRVEEDVAFTRYLSLADCPEAARDRERWTKAKQRAIDRVWERAMGSRRVDLGTDRHAADRAHRWYNGFKMDVRDDICVRAGEYAAEEDDIAAQRARRALWERFGHDSHWVEEFRKTYKRRSDGMIVHRRP